MRSLLISLISFLVFSGCNNKNYSQLPRYQTSDNSNIPNYKNLYYWAAHPDKADPSDSIPKPLRKSFEKEGLVDVFFLHPTTLTDKEKPEWNANIQDVELNIKTDFSAILYQASVFNEKTNVYAPRYRQAHYRAFTTADKPAAAIALDTAYADVRNAFIYYLEHFNNNKPIIIASHSQGTKHAVRLMKEFFDDKPLYNKLVCAYIIGLPVKENEFKAILPCSDPTKTGCFVSWRSYEKGYEGEAYISREKFNAVNINPLTMRNDSAYAPAKNNQGGMLRNFNKLRPGLSDAQSHGNILWVSKPKFFGNIFLNFKNYHIVDYNLFYSNIREDVGKRIGYFWKQ